jgi:hypothetical protein
MPTEAAEALRGEGWTDAEIKHLLTYLTSEKLDGFELKFLRFARETVLCQPCSGRLAPRQ